MIRKIFFTVLSILFAFAILAVSLFQTTFKTIAADKVDLVSNEATASVTKSTDSEASESGKETTEQKVDYYLPYPGILPDHPLYLLKMIRDRIWLTLTSDSFKKAEVLLLFADKRIGAAQVLVQGNKGELGLETAVKAETYLDKSFTQISQYDIADNDTRDFLKKLQLSAQKHEEIVSFLGEKIEDKGEEIKNLQLSSQQIQEKIDLLLN